ncbi:uncharacterized protein (DUF983 family) [Friedmanniella endophytica]|uniref:Uncharacterized protein (DUF983 family) n=1 Tax=Microlunatus kandeliicorticis TaxID=1759536 RepID=A0A7W3IRR1_9ACTN|nr:hypothetical protein [Microlunatus kandeliicorticis]MBA8794051.1 uncharacterized protein (DUF983 family) [Microlunatus kandeliicorticis]
MTLRQGVVLATLAFFTFALYSLCAWFHVPLWVMVIVALVVVALAVLVDRHRARRYRP